MCCRLCPNVSMVICCTSKVLPLMSCFSSLCLLHAVLQGEVPAGVSSWETSEGAGGRAETEPCWHQEPWLVPWTHTQRGKNTHAPWSTLYKLDTVHRVSQNSEYTPSFPRQGTLEVTRCQCTALNVPAHIHMQADMSTKYMKTELFNKMNHCVINC